MDLIRYEPMNLLRRFQDDLNDLFGAGRHVAADDSSVVTSRWAPAVDIREEKDRYVITADVPGVDPKDIEITLERGVLTLKGERKLEREEIQAGWHRVERVYGTFYRRFALPDSVDSERIEAKADNGVLTISVAKLAKAQPRRIAVAA